MGRVHNALPAGLLGRAIKAVVGDVRSEGQLERYAETLQPVVDLWASYEFRKLRAEAPVAGVVEVVAVAAQTNAHRLRNPAGSNALILLDEVTFCTSVASLYDMLVNFATVDLATAVNVKAHRDLRGQDAGTMTNTIARMSGTNNVAGTGQSLRRGQTLAGDPGDTWRPGIVLPPGTSVEIVTVTVNLNSRANFSWRERIAKPGELF